MAVKEQESEESASMKTRQTPIKNRIAIVLMGVALAASFATKVSANSPLTVTEITDWNTAPAEYQFFNDPYLGYSGGLDVGMSTLLVNNGTSSSVYNGFCIDPFHWSATGPSSPYYEVPLVDAPKSPAQLNAYTATEIEKLWAQFFSPTMSSSSAAGLQIAIWELVSSNAIASDSLPANEAFTLTSGNDYGASQDLASLATYAGPVPSLLALTGPGQDYVINVNPVPDVSGTFIMLALTVGALLIARPALIKSASQLRKTQAIPVENDRS